MARNPDWQREMREALRREDWALTGPRRIVKVVPLSYRLMPAVSGYVCLEKVLVGKTPAELGQLLGALHKFDHGVRVYRLTRLPLSSEVNYELSAKHPDGLAYNPATAHPDYPPGAAYVHQWQLLADIPAEVILELKPGQRYPSLQA